MTSQAIRLQADKITDWDSYHLVFAETLGFPSFYGHNMNAWIDCMAYLDDIDASMTLVTVSPGELFHLEVVGSLDFQKRLPEIFQAFIQSVAFVNWQRVELGKRPVLALILS